MGAHKHLSSYKTTKPWSVSAQRTHSEPNDYAQEILWFAIGLQISFLAGSYWKIPFLTSAPLFYAQFLSPAAIVLIASTWRRALKFSFLSSLVIPGGVSLILVLVAIVSFILKPGMGNLLKHVGKNIETSFVVWVVVLTASLPSIATGAIIRIAWSKFRPNSKS